MFRPDDVGKIFGQDHIQEILVNWMEAKDLIPQSILLCGPYGTGKTSIARILANQIVTTRDDLSEINASDSRGIDDARGWAESARFSPFGQGGKVYIIDELHMMTKPAQSALLKIIEEPPPRTYFFLCTTEPGKLIDTIVSRCTILQLRLFQPEDTSNLLSFVYGNALSPEIVEAIHKKTGGHARDAVKMADTAILTKAVTVEDLHNQVGLGIQDIEDRISGLINTFEFVIPHGESSASKSWTSIKDLLSAEDSNALGYTIDSTIDTYAMNREFPRLRRHYGDFLNFRSLRREYKISAKEQLLHLISVVTGRDTP